MDARKKEEVKDGDVVKSDSSYFDVDLDDNVEDATHRLFVPKEKSFWGFFSYFFNCLSRHPEDDAFPESEHSFAEPLTPSFLEVKKK